MTANEVLVKATPYLSVRGFMDETLPADAVERIVAKLSDEFPKEASRLRTRVVASERIPVMLLNRMMELTASELGEPATTLAHRVGTRYAEEASSTVMRLAMVMISIPNLLRKLVPVWTQNYTEGRMSSSSDGKVATIELSEFPVVSATGCARISGMLEWWAQRAEKSAKLKHSACTSSGSPTCRWEVRW